jgi:deazaflavin-dependent oxidoreductase (nitroreductase family)
MPEPAPKVSWGGFSLVEPERPLMGVFDKPPRGVVRLLARLPILIYRAGLGRLLGHRFLLLYHQGRRSGLTRTTVLEVLHYGSGDGSYLIASGFGEKADWLKNLRQSPRTRIQVAGAEHEVLAVFLDCAEGRRELELYADEHPIAARMLFLLFRDASVADWAGMARRFRLVRLLPIITPSRSERGRT